MDDKLQEVTINVYWYNRVDLRASVLDEICSALHSLENEPTPKAAGEFWFSCIVNVAFFEPTEEEIRKCVIGDQAGTIFAEMWHVSFGWHALWIRKFP